MRIVVVGYGRVGSSAIKELFAAGHEVVLIERRPDRVERAGRVENLRIVTGNAIDVAVQAKAGVDRAEVFLALTRADTVNLVAAQVAKLKFSVPHAIARIYIPSYAPIFEKKGIQTLCPTLYTVEAIRSEVEKISGNPPPPRGMTPESKPRPSRISERALDEAGFVLISGGGKIGSGLAATLLSRGVEVAIMEKDPLQAARVSAEIDAPVFVGDGSARGVQETAGAARARVLAAVTGSDEDNLIACQTAKDVFGVEKTIARVSNPRNEETLRALGVDTTVATTAIISSFIERELPGLQIRTLLSLQSGDVRILELQVPPASPAAGKEVKMLPIPPETSIIALMRRGQTIITRGNTLIEAGDTALILVKREHEPQMRRIVLGVP